MSRSNEHVHESRRLHRVLALGVSLVALAGLVYFEGVSARANAEETAEAAEADEALEEAGLDVDDVDEADEADEAENDVRAAKPMRAAPIDAVAPSGPAVAAVATPTDERLAMTGLPALDAAAMPIAPPAPALVAVPDIEGMSLRKAKKQLAAVGLKLAVRDAYGEKVPREYWYEYKVRTQKIDAGTEVAPGSTVKVKARLRATYAAMGY